MTFALSVEYLQLLPPLVPSQRENLVCDICALPSSVGHSPRGQVVEDFDATSAVPELPKSNTGGFRYKIGMLYAQISIIKFAKRIVYFFTSSVKGHAGERFLGHYPEMQLHRTCKYHQRHGPPRSGMPPDSGVQVQTINF